MEKTAGQGETIFNITFKNEAQLLAEGHSLAFRKGVTQAGAQSVTDLGGGTIDVGAAGEFLVQGGTLKGGGTIVGGLRATGGVIEVGMDSAHPFLEVTKKYIQETNATLRIAIRDVNDDWVWGGLSAQTGAELNGTLQISMPDGDVESGTWNAILGGGEGASITGNFGAVTGWEITYGLDFVLAEKQ